MNRGEIRALARKRLGETTGAFWSDAELNGWINLACNDVAFRTKCLKANGFFSAPGIAENQVSEGFNEFTLSALFPDLYSIEEVYFHLEGERWWKLEPINFTDLDIRFPGWRDDIGRTIPPEAGDTIDITAITQAIPGAVTTATAHGYAVDQLIIFSGIVGMTQLNGNQYLVRSIINPTTFELKNLDGTDLDTSGFTAYISDGTVNTLGPTTYNFDSRPGTPQYYYWDRERDLFGLWVPPDEENESSNNVHVYYFKKHVELGDDAEMPDLPEPLHQSIIDWVVYQGFETRGWGDKANDALSKYILKLTDYQTERKREREDDVLTMKNYRNT